jgi:hypothetical protein
MIDIMVQIVINYGLKDYSLNGQNYMVIKRGLTMWRLWAKALGQKEGITNKEADVVAAIRTTIVALYIVTNLFIIAGIMRHWNG